MRLRNKSGFRFGGGKGAECRLTIFPTPLAQGAFGDAGVGIGFGDIPEEVAEDAEDELFVVEGVAFGHGKAS
jgi:hypothetical protein